MGYGVDEVDHFVPHRSETPHFNRSKLDWMEKRVQRAGEESVMGLNFLTSDSQPLAITARQIWKSCRSMNDSRETNRIVRSVMLSQLLFVSGNSLTVGGFFNYFVNQFQPSAFLMAAAMIAPETAQSFSLVSRWVVHRFPNRKRNWIVFLIAGRVVSMLMPLALLWPASTPDTTVPLMLILGCTAVWYFLQGIAYVNYVSWLSLLVPEVNWGRLLSRRQLAGLVVSLGMPLLVICLRQYFLKGQSPEVVRWSYSVLFVTGGLLTLTSLLPLLKYREIPWSKPVRIKLVRFRQDYGLGRSFRYLLGARWWLAFFQGLTQAVLFKYSVEILQISLPTYTVLSSLMMLVQMPLALWAGRCSDRCQEKTVLFWSMIGVSLAMPFWILATPERWYLVTFAYVMWGGFGVLNVSGQSLCLKLSPAGDNLHQLALYDQISGLIAGLAGLLGGLWLDRLLQLGIQSESISSLPYLLIMTVSWIGRGTAAFWLLPIRQPVNIDQSSQVCSGEESEEKGSEGGGQRSGENLQIIEFSDL